MVNESRIVPPGQPSTVADPKSDDNSRPATRGTDELSALPEDVQSRKARSASKRRRSVLSNILKGRVTVEYTHSTLQQDLQDPNFYTEIRDMIVNVQHLREQLQTSQQQNEEHTAEIEQLRDVVAALQSEKELLEEDLTSTHEYVQRIELRAHVQREGSPVSSSRSLKLPDPPLFSGSSTDNLTFEDWLVRMNGKLEGNADYFTSEKLKLAYVVRRLTGNAAKHTAPRLRAGNVAEYQNAAELLEHLREIYEDPDRIDKARREFKKLYMPKSTAFHDFYTKFLHLSSEAQISPTELVQELNDKLSFDLRSQVLSKFLEKPNLSDFARYCTSVDSQLKVISSQKDSLRSRTLTPRESTPTVTLPLRPSVPPVTNTSTITPPSRPQYSDPAKQKLSRLDACFICKKTGHLAKFCPQKNRISSIEEATDVNSRNEQP